MNIRFRLIYLVLFTVTLNISHANVIDSSSIKIYKGFDFLNFKPINKSSKFVDSVAVFTNECGEIYKIILLKDKFLKNIDIHVGVHSTYNKIPKETFIKLVFSEHYGRKLDIHHLQKELEKKLQEEEPEEPNELIIQGECVQPIIIIKPSKYIYALVDSACHDYFFQSFQTVSEACLLDKDLNPIKRYIFKSNKLLFCTDVSYTALDKSITESVYIPLKDFTKKTNLRDIVEVIKLCNRLSDYDFLFRDDLFYEIGDLKPFSNSHIPVWRSDNTYYRYDKN